MWAKRFKLFRLMRFYYSSTLNRLSNTLSGGESQRINLTTNLGSSLVGSVYILDEPSIGLHSRDTDRLIKVLRELQELGNTVVVVEHDEEIMRAADYLIDIGPDAGRLGGRLVYAGPHSEYTTTDPAEQQALLEKYPESHTIQYLTHHETIDGEHVEEGLKFLETLKAPYVLKADGLCAGITWSDKEFLHFLALSDFPC